MTSQLLGIKVVDFAGHGFVPSAAAALADRGADVVKIERPGGDPLRAVIRNGLVADADGTDYIPEIFNRNKRAIALAVETAGGREVFERLVKWADVYVTNQLPRVRRKLRTEPDDLLALNPRIIYTKGHGQGQRGPDADAGGFDSVPYWSRGGGPHAQLARGHLRRAGQRGTHLEGCRRRHVAARRRDVNLAPDTACTSIAGREPPRTPPDPAARSPLVGPHRTADGRWFSLSMLDEDRDWSPSRRALGLDDLVDRFPDTAARSAHRRLLNDRIDAAIAQRHHDELDAGAVTAER